MNWRERLEGAEARINALSLRERALMTLAVLAVVFLLWDALVMGPINSRSETTRTQLEEVGERVDSTNRAIEDFVRGLEDDEQAELAAEREGLEARIERLEARLEDVHGGVSSPRAAVDTLARLLADQPGLELIELENLPPEALEGRDGDTGGVWIHRVRLVFQAAFDDGLGYLERVENLPEGVYWESVDISVPAWPENRVELVLYSLAVDEAWLGI